MIFFVGSDCKIGIMLTAKLTSASGISKFSLSSLRNNSNNAWSLVSNDGFDKLVRFLSLITFGPFTDSFLIEEGELELGLLRGKEETSALTEAATRDVL